MKQTTDGKARLRPLSALLAAIADRGITLDTDGRYVYILGGADHVTPAIRRGIEQYERELVFLLGPDRLPQTGQDGGTPSGPPGRATLAAEDRPGDRTIERGQWDRDTAEMIERFHRADQDGRLPTDPFPWRWPGSRVDDPAQFYDSLRQAITAGPTGTRAAFGALASDLAALLRIVDDRAERGRLPARPDESDRPSTVPIRRAA